MINQNRTLGPLEDKEPVLNFDYSFIAMVVAMMFFSPESLGEIFKERNAPIVK